MKTELPTPSLVNGSTRYSSPSAVPPMTGTNGVVTPRPSIASLEARVRRYNSDIDAGSARFRAAVLLLAAAEFGRNIDALSRRTGYPRGFVAQCARRWIDNGVWTPQGLVTEWSPADEASGAFWNDVAVAEGKLCRRVNADGEIEWAPPGFWNKSYEFIDAAAKSQLGTVYRDPTTIGEAPPDKDADDDDGGESVRVDPPSSTAPETDPTDAPPPPPAAPPPAVPPPVGSNDTDTGPSQTITPEAPRVRRPAPPLQPVGQPAQPPAELFPDTVWIG